MNKTSTHHLLLYRYFQIVALADALLDSNYYKSLMLPKRTLFSATKLSQVLRDPKYLVWAGYLSHLKFMIIQHNQNICDKVDKMYFSIKGSFETNIFPASTPFPIPSQGKESVQSVIEESSLVTNHQDLK